MASHRADAAGRGVPRHGESGAFVTFREWGGRGHQAAL